MRDYYDFHLGKHKSYEPLPEKMKGISVGSIYEYSIYESTYIVTICKVIDDNITHYYAVPNKELRDFKRWLKKEMIDECRVNVTVTGSKYNYVLRKYYRRRNREDEDES